MKKEKLTPPAVDANLRPPVPFIGSNRQREMYTKGISGARPKIPVDMAKLQAKAQSKMSPEAFAYIAGGAGLGETMNNNRSAFNRWRIVPRMLRDVSQLDTSVELFGQRLPTPFLTAPIGVLEMAHPQADLAVAQATSRLGVPMIFSNQASFPMETCAAQMGDSPRWFQLYWSKSNDLVASFVARAESCGCSAIVLTLDTTMLGWRIADLDLGYLPFLRGKGIAQYTSDPVFRQLLERPDDEPPSKNKLTFETIKTAYQVMKNYPDQFTRNLRSRLPIKAVRKFINIYSRPSLTWEDLPFLRQHTQLPILLKGIQHPDDARRAVAAGIDGIIVSNHGGRQVDGALGAIEALPGVVAAVNGQIPVLMDSGIRGGADVFKALALGAKAVCIGRPYVYALSLEGADGVEELMKNFIADFSLTMGLAGCRSVAEIGPECLVENKTSG